MRSASAQKSIFSMLGHTPLHVQNSSAFFGASDAAMADSFLDITSSCGEI